MNSSEGFEDYEQEIADLARELDVLTHHGQLTPSGREEKRVREIEEHVQVLRALLRAALATFTAGAADLVCVGALELLGYGEWTPASVYAYVYDTTMDRTLVGDDVAHWVHDTDFVVLMHEVERAV